MSIKKVKKTPFFSTLSRRPKTGLPGPLGQGPARAIQRAKKEPSEAVLLNQ